MASQNVRIHLPCAEFCLSETYYQYQPIYNDESAQIVDSLVYLTEKETDWGLVNVFITYAT